MKFDENTLNMSGMGDIMDDRENLSVILGILTENYKQIKRIIEKKPGINFHDWPRDSRREWDSMQIEEWKEVALKEARERSKNERFKNSRVNAHMFNGNFLGVESVDTT